MTPISEKSVPVKGKSHTKKIFFHFLLCAFFLYLPSLNAPFQFDSFVLIYNNPLIKNLDNLLDIWVWDPSRFITHCSFALNYFLTQIHVFGYHIVNVLLHFLVTCVLFQFLQLTLLAWSKQRKQLIDQKHQQTFILFACLLFLIHPIQTSAVTYIVQRSTVLATLFYLSSLTAYARFRVDKKGCFYFLALFSAFLSIFCKPIVVTLPLTIILYEFFFFSETIPNLKKQLPNILPFIFIAGLVPVLLTLWRHKYIKLDELWHMTRQDQDITRWNYLLTQFNVILTYLRLLFYPVNLRLDYDYPMFTRFWSYPTYLCFFIILTIIGIGVKLFKKHRLIAFGIAWFFVTLSLESSIFPISDFIFEHRLYLPMIGFAIILPAVVINIFPDKKHYKAILSSILLILACMTFYRNIVWSDKIVMIKDSIRKSPNKARLYSLLGTALVTEGRYEEALKSYDRIVALNPDNPNSYIERAKMLLLYGKQDQALEDLNRSIALRPLNEAAFLTRQAIYRMQGKLDLAMADIEKALALNPDLDNAYISRGIIHSLQGSYEEAKSDFDHVIKKLPNHLKGHLYRAKFYFHFEEFDKALSDLNKTIQIDPNFLCAYAERAAIYTRLKKYDLALADLNVIISQNQYHFKALAHRGLIQGLKGDFAGAIQDYNKSITLNPYDLSLYLSRGKIFQQLGEANKAMDDYDFALKLNLETPDAYAQKAQIYSSTKQFDLALNNINKAIEGDPENFMHFYNRSRIYFQMDRYKEAVKDLNLSIELEPNFPLSYNNRGSIYLQQNEYSQALEDFNKAINLQPDYGLAYYNRSLTFKLMNDYSAALEDALNAQALGYPIEQKYIDQLKQ